MLCRVIAKGLHKSVDLYLGEGSLNEILALKIVPASLVVRVHFDLLCKLDAFATSFTLSLLVSLLEGRLRLRLALGRFEG